MTADNSNLLIQIVIGITAVVTTYLTVKYKNVILSRNKEAPPKDRMEQIFDGYEKLIIQQQEDIQRKTNIITGLEDIVDKLRSDLDHTTDLLEQAREEVRESKKQNSQMKHQLDSLKKGYSHDKAKKAV